MELYFQISLVENKPEAPWIRKDEKGVVFTDNMQYVEGLDLNTEEDQQQNKKKLKQDLKLDEKVQKKLNKLLNSPKGV